MKAKLMLLTAALGLAATSGRADLILTGIIDGPLSGGTPKAIELYVVNDISDLSQYGVELVSNADSSSGAIETAFSGSATAGDFLYVASEAPNFTSFFGFAPDFLTTDVNHNGDDDLYIYGPSNTLIDVWGGSDGLDNTGTAYDILDSWAYRNNEVGPNTTFTVAEWTINAPNTLDGETTAAGAGVTFGIYTAIPEPSSIALMGVAGIALYALSRRKN